MQTMCIPYVRESDSYYFLLPVITDSAAHCCSFHPLVSEMNASVFEFHYYKQGCQSKIKNRMANSVDPDEMSANAQLSCAWKKFYNLKARYRKLLGPVVQSIVSFMSLLRVIFVFLCWGFMAQSTQWGHVERGQFT